MSPLPRFIFNPLVNYMSKRESIGQGALITGTDPVVFMTSDPLRLWVIQVGIIIATSQLLSLGLRKLRQPKVIAELLGGILLGPSAFGRIPGFTERIFPSVSLPYLSLVADIGLCFFFFLVGLEIDINSVKRKLRTATIISLAGIAVPFGLGSVLSVPLYRHFIDPSVHFTYFMLFTGLAYSVTAFAVLCRVLTELRLLDTRVGIVVLSAGVCNEVIGWTLLALNVALVNADSGLSALWILLVCLAFSVFLLFPVKFFLLWLARQTGSTENGPTMFYMTVVMILLWACAFFADSIGVNAIFGALFAGIIVPREGGLTIALTEKLEDVVAIVFLPLYFALSGLNTDLGLLNNGITWAFTIAIIIISFTGKFFASLIASRVTGYSWRESGTIGALMSCKGLMDLIVLNAGLRAGILSKRVFSMFVFEAVVVTLTITPLAMTLYIPERRIRAGESLPCTQGDSEHGDLKDNDNKASLPSSLVIEEGHPWRRRFMVVLDKLDHVPSAMALTQLMFPPRNIPSDTTWSTTITTEPSGPDVNVEALRLVELSDRTSAAMMMIRSSSMSASVADSSAHLDPVLAIFRTFGELNQVAVTTSLAVVPSEEFAESIAEHAQKNGSQMVLLPWILGLVSMPIQETAAAASFAVAQADTGGEEGNAVTSKLGHRTEHNDPLEALFGSASGSNIKTTNTFPAVVAGIHHHLHLHPQSLALVHGVFTRCSKKTDVAVLVDTGCGGGGGGHHAVHDHLKTGLGGGPVHVFLPFFGGADDRLALELVVQLCLSPGKTATVVRSSRPVNREDDAVEAGKRGPGEGRPSTGHLHHQTKKLAGSPSHVEVAHEAPSTILADKSDGRPTTPAHLQSETADDIAWANYTNSSTVTALSPELHQAVSRIRFSDMDVDPGTSTQTHMYRSVQAAIQHTHALRSATTHIPRMLVVVGRSQRGPLSPRRTETSQVQAHQVHHHHYWWSGDSFERMRRAIGDVATAMVVGASASAVLVVQAAVADAPDSASVVD